MANQNTTTGGTGTPPPRRAGNEIKPGPNTKVRELGGNQVEIVENGVKSVGHKTPDGRIIRDS